MTAGNGLSIWDLGYVSTVNCKLVASVELEDYRDFFRNSGYPRWKGTSHPYVLWVSSDLYNYEYI